MKNSFVVMLLLFLSLVTGCGVSEKGYLSYPQHPDFYMIWSELDNIAQHRLLRLGRYLDGAIEASPESKKKSLGELSTLQTRLDVANDAINRSSFTEDEKGDLRKKAQDLQSRIIGARIRYQ